MSRDCTTELQPGQQSENLSLNIKKKIVRKERREEEVSRKRNTAQNREENVRKVITEAQWYRATIKRAPSILKKKKLEGESFSIFIFKLQNLF